jgi:hypothetical protein
MMARKHNRMKRIAQQGETFAEAGNMAVDGLLFYFRRAQPEDGNHRDDRVNGEENAPAQTEERQCARSSPQGDEGCEERSDGFDELPEGERASQSVALDDGADEWVERSLHQCVANTEQREGNEHHGETLTEDGDEQ